MPIMNLDEGDDSHPPSVEVTEPESLTLLQALDYIQSISSNQRTVRLAFQVVLDAEQPPPGRLRRAYLVKEQTIPPQSRQIGQPPTAPMLWAGVVDSYAGVRKNIQDIANRGVAMEQRALTNLVIRYCPSLKGYRDQIVGIERWLISGRR